jgi:hypothetical protein
MILLNIAFVVNMLSTLSNIKKLVHAEEDRLKTTFIFISRTSNTFSKGKKKTVL